MSGVELAYEVLEQSGVESERIKPTYIASRSEEFWTGWALAYYQWETSMSFAEIVRYVTIKDMIALYQPYHEMDIRQFVDKVNAMYKAAKPETNLKLLRQKAGLSQRELADLSGVRCVLSSNTSNGRRTSTRLRRSILSCWHGCYAVSGDLIEKTE